MPIIIKAKDLKPKDKVVLEVESVSHILGTKDAYCVRFKRAEALTDLVGHDSRAIVIEGKTEVEVK